MARRDAFYHAVRLTSRPVFGAWFRLTSRGVESVPRVGPAIVAGNHVSYLDPAVLGSVVPRPVRFLISAQVWAHPSMNFFYRWMRSIPVDRSGSPARAAIRASLDALRAGEIVGIFPEGGRTLPGHDEAPLVGVAVLARQSGAPVIPCGIRGTDEAMPVGAGFPRPCRIEVRFGSPLRYAEVAPVAQGTRGRDGDARFTRELMDAIRRLALPVDEGTAA